MKRNYDVVVVGGGPAGAAAAHEAVKNGLRTLIIEKHKMPRHKTCSGMLMPECVDLLKNNFGDIPKKLLSEPIMFHSIRLHFDSGRTYDIPLKALIVKRNEFDRWLCEQSGADIQDEVELADFNENSGGVMLTCNTKNNRRDTVSCSVMIGADGSRSNIGYSLDPGRREKIVWYTVSQFYHKGTADLEPGYFHVFSSENLCFYPAAYWKEKTIVVDTNIPTGHNMALERNRFTDFLGSRYGFKSDGIARRAGCMYALPARRGLFQTGSDRIFLAGDAGGFTRFLGEGITAAIATGTIAGSAAFQGLNTGRSPGEMYRKLVRGEMKLSRGDFSFGTHLKRYMSGFKYNSWAQRILSAGDLIHFSRSIASLENRLIKKG